MMMEGVVANLDDGIEKHQEKSLHTLPSLSNCFVLGGVYVFVSLTVKVLLQQKYTG